MKAKLLIIALVALTFSGIINACPVGAYAPDSKFRWLAEGQFNGTSAHISGIGLRTFVRDIDGANRYLRHLEINLDSWRLTGVAQKRRIFNYSGTGTRDFTAATQTVRSLFVPVRRAEPRDVD